MKHAGGFRGLSKQVRTMVWDLGLNGIALLAGMSIVFGLLTELVASRWANRWIGLVGAAAYFVAGIFVSEAWFGWATEEELQPNVDGLSFDEVFLLATLLSIAVVVVVGVLVRRRVRS